MLIQSEQYFHWVSERLTEWANGSQSERTAHRVSERLTEWANGSLSERTAHWVSERLTEWANGSQSDSFVSVGGITKIPQLRKLCHTSTG